MTGTFCTGWDRNAYHEWALKTSRIERWFIVRRFRKEMRGL